MAYRMFIYDMGCVDYFQGMMPLLDYIKLCPVKDRNGSPYLSHRELKGFLINCFMEISVSKSKWQGDVRESNAITISAIPNSGDMKPNKFIAFKQDQKGYCFLVSECKLHDKTKEDKDLGFGVSWVSTDRENLDYRDYMVAFYHAFDLVEALFEKALCGFGSDVDRIMEALQRSHKVPLELVPNNSQPKDEKFDLKNYDSL